MTAEIALNDSFKEVMREKILTAFMGLIPQEKIDELVSNEIKAFFQTDQLLTIQETKVELDNPNYKSNSNSFYGNDKKLNKDALVFGSRMTPFRQMVWSLLYQQISPKLKAVFENENSQVNTELDQWMTEQVTPQVKETHKSNFTQLATAMSSIMLGKVMRDAITASHANSINMLNQAGIPSANMTGVYNLTPIYPTT